MKILMVIMFVLCLVCLGWTIHCSVTYYRFSESIKQWAIELDNSMKDALERAARKLLMDMDARIEEEKQKSQEEDEINNNVEIIDEEND